MPGRRTMPGRRIRLLALLLWLCCIPGLRAQSTGSGESADGALAATSVAPGINEGFLDPNLDVTSWVERFEVESREVYHARDEVMRSLGLKPGDRVADIGAGTGFYSLLMAERVGPEGWVFAVDIAPKFVEHLARQFADRGVGNATTVLCDERSVRLPPESIRVAFICDVYHHFEFPHDTMRSLHRALRADGRVFVIDFDRIPGVSREWTLDHVRAGKETFIDEIRDAGFELVAERAIPGFEENYFLEFRKPADRQ